MTDELKACPFCGSEPVERMSKVDGNTYCGCWDKEDCPMAGWFTAKEWNTRPIEDALNKRIAELEGELAELKERFDITDGLLNQATVSIGAVIACCTYNSNAEAMAGAYGISYRAFTMIDNFIKNYNRAVLDGKASTDVKNIICWPNPPEVDENEKLKARIAELEVDNAELKKNNEHMLDCIFEYETIAPDGQLGVSLLNMDNHIRSLEVDNAELKRRLAEMDAANTDLLSSIANIKQIAVDNGREIRELKVKLATAEQMVERLIETGNTLDRWIEHFRSKEDATTATQINWHALVAEWQANQEGDSNV